MKLITAGPPLILFNDSNQTHVFNFSAVDFDGVVHSFKVNGI